MVWIFLLSVVWIGLQFRPARQKVWASRWQRFWFPFLLAMKAMMTMAWMGFVMEPAKRAWMWERTRRESRSLDQTIKKLLGD